MPLPPGPSPGSGKTLIGAYPGFIFKEIDFNVFARYFCDSNSNQFLAAWENSRAVLDIIQTPTFYYFCDLYIFLRQKKQTALTLNLHFESPTKF